MKCELGTHFIFKAQFKQFIVHISKNWISKFMLESIVRLNSTVLIECSVEVTNAFVNQTPDMSRTDSSKILEIQER